VSPRGGTALACAARDLERVLREYVRYFNSDRPHQDRDQQLPLGAAAVANAKGRVVLTPVLGGLHHAYRRAA
jgi:hypothetical protein